VTTDQATTAGYTVEQLAAKVGMSTRNIRAHQARKLLAPPVRRGRVALYDDAHVRRLETIKALQRQGFNLVSIEAMLGVRGGEPDGDGLTSMLQRLAATHPSLVYALSRHGVTGRAPDGTVRLVRPRTLRSALELRRASMGTVPALQVLSEVLDGVQHIADELVNAVSARILVLAPDFARQEAQSFQDIDRDTLVLTQGLIGLLTEAFRVAVENHAESQVIDLLDRRMDGGLKIDDTAIIDNG
jgi:DNA-binding transcriptional MerR regulator